MCTVKLEEPHSNTNVNVRRLESEKVRPTVDPRTETSFVVNIEVVGKFKKTHIYTINLQEGLQT